MEKLSKILKWIDLNLLKIVLFGFIFIIPLYPKFPFLDLEYTYISIRLEDLYIAFVCLVFFIQLIRKKVALRTNLLPYFVLFWISVFLSFIVGHYIMHTIPVMNIGFLHAARRVEYMVIFFIALSSIKSKADLLFYLKASFFVVLLVCLYGIGQKWFEFPAVQTMNPEFARGHLLQLTPEARVSSTFGGHYDLAAYLVFFMPIVLGLYFKSKKILYFLLFTLCVYVLVLTASRVSYIAYLVSIFTFLIFMKKPKEFILILLITIPLTLFSKNLTSRIFKTLQIKQIFINQKTGQVVVPEQISSKELPAGSFYVQYDKDKVQDVSSTTSALMMARLLDDIREQASREGKVLTSSQEAALVGTASSQLTPVSTVISDISFATRLQVEWPRAIEAFMKNPLLGTGASSITESTDNDYLRWIGEFGILATGFFLFILFSIIKSVWTAIPKFKKEDQAVFLGFLFGVGALLINAGYIDVFEASKVAYTFWFVAGIFMGSLLMYEKN